MRKFKKNFKGDSLIEIITSFAIIAIVGVITITGVVASGRIKVNTSNLQRASLSADSNLQTQNISSGGPEANIYNKSDYDIKNQTVKSGKTALTDNSDIILSNYTASSDSSLAKSLSYTYYSDPATSEDTPQKASGSGSFGLGGMWFIRFYLEESVTDSLNTYLSQGKNFYIVISYSNGVDKSSTDMENDNSSVTVCGIQNANPNESTNRTDWCYGNNNSGGIAEAMSNHYSYNGSLDISSITDTINNKSKTTVLTFENGKYCNVIYGFKPVSTNKYAGIQTVDVALYWSSCSGYNIDFNIVVEDGKDINGKMTYKFLSDKNGGVPYRKELVYGREIAGGTEDDTFSYYSNLYPNANSDVSVINSSTGKYNNMYDIDSEEYYIYLWKKNDTTYQNGVWSTKTPDGKNFDKWNVDYMLTLSSGNSVGINNFVSVSSDSNIGIDAQRRFREYLRLNDPDYYSKYLDFMKSQGMDTTKNPNSDGEHLVCYAFYVYYILDIYQHYDNKYNISIKVNGFDVLPNSFTDYCSGYAPTSLVTNVLEYKNVLKSLKAYLGIADNYQSFYVIDLNETTATSITLTFKDRTTGVDAGVSSTNEQGGDFTPNLLSTYWNDKEFEKLDSNNSITFSVEDLKSYTCQYFKVYNYSYVECFKVTLNY